MSEGEQGIVVGVEKRLVAAFHETSEICQVATSTNHLFRREISDMTAFITQHPSGLIEEETLDQVTINDLSLGECFPDEDIIDDVTERNDRHIQREIDSHPRRLTSNMLDL